MSDAQWIDVGDDISTSVKHFKNALVLRSTGTFDTTFEGLRDQTALMHLMQSAHNAAEAGLLRILAILDEEAPTGKDWHQVLIDRLARPLGGGHERPALLPADVAAALHETRNFRHRATHNYGDFDVTRSGPSMDAAGRLIASLPVAIAAFKEIVDPD